MSILQTIALPMTHCVIREFGDRDRQAGRACVPALHEFERVLDPALPPGAVGRVPVSWKPADDAPGRAPRISGMLLPFALALGWRVMTRDEILDFFARQQQAWLVRNPEALAAGHAEDGTLVSPIFGTLQGRATILTSYKSLFQVFPDWAYTGEQLVVDGTRVAEPFSVTATHVGVFMGLEGTGRRFTIHGIRLFDMHAGAIAYERRYYDFTGLLIQLGILRSKPARPSTP